MNKNKFPGGQNSLFNWFFFVWLFIFRDIFVIERVYRQDSTEKKGRSLECWFFYMQKRMTTIPGNITKVV
jgi:hypothetical protein